MNDHAFTQRSKNKGYPLYPLSEIDRISLNPELIGKVEQSEQEIKEGKSVRVKTKDELLHFLNSL